MEYITVILAVGMLVLILAMVRVATGIVDRIKMLEDRVDDLEFPGNRR